MGGSNSTPAAANAAAVPAGSCPVKHEAVQSQCPVKHDAKVEENASTGECPVKHDGAVKKPVYNVYAQEIDPTNNMPFNPNQLPAPGQKKALVTERVQSCIPKGGTEGETWQYPSPQMFYNALVRKGKAEDVDENELDTIVAVHNNMNERAWNLVINWERALHPEEFQNGVKLSRFMGRPHDISPLAWVKSTFMGYPKPFDRHDWIIDRNGKEVRYVIDFYFDDVLAEQDMKPELHDAKSIKSISMDARPALDSFESFVDRIKFPLLEKFEKLPSLNLTDNAFFAGKSTQPATNATDGKVESTTFDSMTSEDVKNYSKQIGESCASCFEKMNSCGSETDCQRASVALTHCMASLVCKPESARYLAKPSDLETFESMVSCMGRFEDAALKLRTSK